MKINISVVISAYNEEAKLEDCLKSVKDFAKEIIVVDNSSTDRTGEIAKKYTDKVFVQKNDPQKIDVQKNFGISKATSDWVIVLDADERITPELIHELDSVISNQKSEISGYWIPRKNIIFGKWIEHTGWYPDPQLRFFRKGQGKYREGVLHQHIEVKGNLSHLAHHIEHQNYDSISQFLEKMVFVYTVSEANNLLENSYKFVFIDLIKKPISEFNKRYFAEKGYKDGMHGLALSLLMAFYHFIVYLRVWEAKGYPTTSSLEVLREGMKIAENEGKYWIAEVDIQEEKSPLKKGLKKIKRKIS